MAKILAIVVRRLKQIFSPANVWRGLVGGHGEPPPAPAPRPEDGYERHDVRSFPLLMAGIGLLATVAIVSAVIWGMFTFLINRPLAGTPVSPLAAQRQTSDVPRLETVPGSTLQATLQRSGAILGSYGWVDQAHGVVHIPINHAIDLMLQRGLPTRATSAVSSTTTMGGQAAK